MYTQFGSFTIYNCGKIDVYDQDSIEDQEYTMLPPLFDSSEDIDPQLLDFFGVKKDTYIEAIEAMVAYGAGSRKVGWDDTARALSKSVGDKMDEVLRNMKWNIDGTAEAYTYSVSSGTSDSVILSPDGTSGTLTTGTTSGTDGDVTWAIPTPEYTMEYGSLMDHIKPLEENSHSCKDNLLEYQGFTESFKYCKICDKKVTDR